MAERTVEVTCDNIFHRGPTAKGAPDVTFEPDQDRKVACAKVDEDTQPGASVITALDTASNDDATHELEVAHGTGPTAAHRAATFDGAANADLIDDWKVGAYTTEDPTEITSAQIMAREALYQLAGQREALRYRFNRRLRPYLTKAIDFDGSRYLPLHTEHSYRRSKTLVEAPLLERDDTISLGLEQRRTSGSGGSGGGGTTSGGLTGSTGGVGSWDDITGKPADLFSRSGTKGTVKIALEDLKDAAGYTPANASPGTGLTSTGTNQLAFDTDWGDNRYQQAGDQSLTINDGSDQGVILTAIQDTLRVTQQDGGGLGHVQAGRIESVPGTGDLGATAAQLVAISHNDYGGGTNDPYQAGHIESKYTSATNADYIEALRLAGVLESDADVSNWIIATTINAIKDGTGTAGELNSQRVVVQNKGGGTATKLLGHKIEVRNIDAGTTSGEMVGLEFGDFVGATNSAPMVTAFKGISIPSANLYGIDASSDNVYSIWDDSGFTAWFKGTLDAGTWDLLLQEVQDIDHTGRSDAQIIYWDAQNSVHKYIDVSDLVTEKGTLRIGDIGLASSGHYTESPNAPTTSDGSGKVDGHVWLHIHDPDGDGVDDVDRYVWDADAGAWQPLSTGIAGGLLANDSIYTKHLTADSITADKIYANAGEFGDVTAKLVSVINDSDQTVVKINQNGISANAITGTHISATAQIHVGQGDPHLLLDGQNDHIVTTDYVPGLVGGLWSAGLLEVQDALIRGTLRTILLEEESLSTAGGILAVLPSTSLAAKANATDTTIYVKSQKFEVDDYIRLKEGNKDDIIKVTAVDNNPPTGAQGLTLATGLGSDWAKGTAVAHWNSSGIIWQAEGPGGLPVGTFFDEQHTRFLTIGDLTGVPGLSGEGLALGQQALIWQNGALQLRSAQIDESMTGPFSISATAIQGGGLTLNAKDRYFAFSSQIHDLDVAFGDIDRANLPDRSNITSSFITGAAFPTGWQTPWTAKTKDAYTDLNDGTPQGSTQIYERDFSVTECAGVRTHSETALTSDTNNSNPPIQFTVGTAETVTCTWSDWAWSQWVTQDIDLSTKAGDELTFKFSYEPVLPDSDRQGESTIQVVLLETGTSNVLYAKTFTHWHTADNALKTVNAPFTVPASGAVTIAFQVYCEEGKTLQDDSTDPDTYQFFPTSMKVHSVELWDAAFNSVIAADGMTWRDASSNATFLLDAKTGDVEIGRDVVVGRDLDVQGSWIGDFNTDDGDISTTSGKVSSANAALLSNGVLHVAELDPANVSAPASGVYIFRDSTVFETVVAKFPSGTVRALN